VILAAFNLSGFGVDGDAFAVGPVAVVEAERIAERAQACGGFGRKPRLKVEGVGKVLMVEARGVDGLLDIEAALGCGQENVAYRGDDACSAGRAQNVAQLAVFEHDGGGH
jgi:hypothetical protein